MAGDELCFVADQIDRRPGHVVGLGDPPERDLPRQLGVPRLPPDGAGQRVEDRRVGEHRMDRVAGDAILLLGAMQRDRFGQVADGGLGAVVGGAVVGGDDPGDRRDVEDRALDAAVLHRPRHQRQRQLAAEEDTVEIDRVDMLPRFEARRLDRRPPRDPGVVDEDVQTAERRLGKGDRRRPLIGIGHVVRHARRHAGMRGIDRRRRRGRTGSVDIGQHDARPFGGELARHRGTQPLRRPRHQRDLARQPVHVVIPQADFGRIMAVGGGGGKGRAGPPPCCDHATVARRLPAGAPRGLRWRPDAIRQTQRSGHKSGLPWGTA